MSMLTEQRTAKIIDLLEELRRDMPTVRDRVDLEAEALTRTVDPHEVLATLESKLEETLEAPQSEEAAQRVAEEIDAAAAETQDEIEQARHDSATLLGRGGP